MEEQVINSSPDDNKITVVNSVIGIAKTEGVMHGCPV